MQRNVIVFSIAMAAAAYAGACASPESATTPTDDGNQEGEGEGGSGGDAGAGGDSGSGGASGSSAGTGGSSKGGSSGKGGSGGGGSAGKGGSGGASGAGTSSGGGGSSAGKGGSGTGNGPSSLDPALMKANPNVMACTDTGTTGGTCGPGLLCRIYTEKDGRCEGCTPCGKPGSACTLNSQCGVDPPTQCYGGSCRELCPLATGTCKSGGTCKNVGNDKAGVCIPLESLLDMPRYSSGSAEGGRRLDDYLVWRTSSRFPYWCSIGSSSPSR